MSDLIDRQQAIDAAERNACNTQRIIEAIRALPPARLGMNLAEVGTDLISRAEAIVRTSKVIKDDMVAHDVKEALKHLPPTEPKRGKWIEYIPEHGRCPFCGNQVDLLNGKENNFCGECGAKMEGEQNEVD